tara:strand:+ start:545 stop:661 length:117 start_codon:yes stop_codon:yes gene_type:complete
VIAAIRRSSLIAAFGFDLQWLAAMLAMNRIFLVPVQTA